MKSGFVAEDDRVYDIVRDDQLGPIRKNIGNWYVQILHIPLRS